MGVKYGGAIYETMGAAQKAAVDDYLTASGRQQPGAAVDAEDTPQTIARDMVADNWPVPGIAVGWGDPEIGKLTDLVAARLEAHSVQSPIKEADRTDDQIASEAVRRKGERDGPLTKANMEGLEDCDICLQAGINSAAAYRTKRKYKEWGDVTVGKPRRIYVCEGCYQAMEDSP